MKSKKLKILVVLLLIVVTACVKSPDHELVVNKGDNRLSEAIGKNGEGFSVSQYRETLPRIWTENIEKKNQAVIVQINANISFPDVDDIPTVEVIPCGNDLEAIRWLGEHMAQGAYWGKIPVDQNGEKLRTKNVILSEIEHNSDLIEHAEQLHPEWSNDQLSEYRNVLEEENANLSEEYSNAPFNEIKRIDDLSELKTSSFVQIGLFSKSDHCIADVSFVFDQENAQREQVTIWGGGTDSECFEYWPEPINDIETAIRCGNQILKEIGYDSHYEVAKTTEGSVGIGVTYAPKYKSIGYSLGKSNELLTSYEEYYPEDMLELVFARGTGRLRFVQWNGNSRFVRETSENIELLPFNEIQGIIKSNLEYLFSWTNENIHNRTIEITGIKLEYKRVKVMNNQKRLLVPSWAVSGKILDYGISVDVDTGDVCSFEAVSADGVLLVINAVDGTLVESINLD